MKIDNEIEKHLEKMKEMIETALDNAAKTERYSTNGPSYFAHAVELTRGIQTLLLELKRQEIPVPPGGFNI